jgi:hypothetical protein
MPEPSAFETLLARARDDSDVVGVVLSGSQARQGMPTAHSDFDVYVITADRTGPGAAWATVRATDLDQTVMALEAFRAHALPAAPRSGPGTRSPTPKCCSTGSTARSPG